MKAHFSQVITWAAFALLLCAGLCFALQDYVSQKNQSLIVEDEFSDLGSLGMETVTTEIRIRNPSDEERWIVGMDKG